MIARPQLRSFPFARAASAFRPAQVAQLAQVFVVAACMAFGAPALADAPPIKPGLWEITAENPSMNGRPMPDMSAQMAEQLKKMPPDMRKQMEAHLKAKGVEMVPGKGQPTVRVCLTREMLDQDRWQQAQGQCRNTDMQRQGSTWKWKFKCTQPAGEGEGQTTFEGSDAYITDLRMQTRQQDRVQQLDIRHRGRWIGADCGDIKPLTPPPPAAPKR